MKATGIKGYRKSHLSLSGNETPMSPDVIHTPDATKEISLETTNQTLKMARFGVEMTPINPYLGGNVQIKLATLVLEVLLDPNMSRRGQESAGKPLILKGQSSDIIGGSSAPFRPSPEQDPNILFSHTSSRKSARVGGWRLQREILDPLLDMNN